MFKLNVFKSIDLHNTTKERYYQWVSAKVRLWSYGWDCFLVLVMSIVLYWGASTQFSNKFIDVYRYQCYAIAFWHGTPGLAALPQQQCAFIDATAASTIVERLSKHHFPAFLIHFVLSQSTLQPLHTLPLEYPFLALIPFSAVMFVSPAFYATAFAMFMAFVLTCIYVLLKRYRSSGSAIVFAVYIMLGNWATAEVRFDPITAALTLTAVILATRKHWKWAFALLALATLLKFYPVVLLPPLLIAQQQEHKGKDAWTTWSRWSGFAVFVAVCSLVTVVSLFLNVADTLYPFLYFFSRPIQIESFPANFVWLGSLLGYPAQYPFTYQSLNIVSALSSKVGLLSDVLSIAGLLYICWLQWRGKIDLFLSCLLALLIAIAFGKVFSPQFLIWVAPFVAYIGKNNWKWLLSWGCVCTLTTYIFPFMYSSVAHTLNDYPVIVARDLLIVAIAITLMVYATSSRQSAASKQPYVTPELSRVKVEHEVVHKSRYL
jgi:hypothetical protein